MNTTHNYIDYGVYIDRKHAYIIALDHIIHEAFIEEEVEENEAVPGRTKKLTQQEHVQNARNEQLKRFCKTVIEKLQNAHHIVIFGPSVSKYELQKEIHNHNQLKHIGEELIVTDVMDEEAAKRFVKKHYASASSINKR